MFLIDKLQYLVFNTPKMEAMTDFYERIHGMTRIESGKEDEVWLGQYSSIPALILRKATTASLCEVGLTCHGEDAWKEIIKRLEARGIAYEVSESEIFGKTGRFADSDGHQLNIHLPKHVSPLANRNAARVGPQLGRLQHVTYASPSPLTLAEFYVDVLNFRISDKVEGNKFVWFRTDSDHHTVAAAAHTEVGLDHYAYELPDWDAFKEWCDYLGEQDVEVIWGPGRHGPGNNLFIFTLDPDGNRIEYSGEMEKFRDKHMDYTARVWKEKPQTVNLWGVGAPWARKLPEQVGN